MSHQHNRYNKMARREKRKHIAAAQRVISHEKRKTARAAKRAEAQEQPAPEPAETEVQT